MTRRFKSDAQKTDFGAPPAGGSSGCMQDGAGGGEQVGGNMGASVQGGFGVGAGMGGNVGGAAGSAGNVKGMFPG